MNTKLFLLVCGMSISLAKTWAHPIHDATKVKIELPVLLKNNKRIATLPLSQIRSTAKPVLRVDLDWDEATNQYTIAQTSIELSGTEAMYARAKNEDPLGSFKGKLVSKISGQPLSFAAVGTGHTFIRMTRGLSFRFPLPSEDIVFTLTREHPESGEMQDVLSYDIAISSVLPRQNPDLTYSPDLLEVKLLKGATASPSLVMNIYAEGYLANKRENFWLDAQKAVLALEEEKFPLLENLHIQAVFYPSNKMIGYPRALPGDRDVWDSFLGLFWPYWFGSSVTMEYVIYPTSERKYRDGIGVIPYDYPLTLVDSSRYWGVGNYKELTAVPAKNPDRFRFLLMHEFGHYFGLNEEYSGGGTELEFAKNIPEPWSQNITFQNTREKIKWRNHILDDTPIPTPDKYWFEQERWGAYEGGYGGLGFDISYKPGLGNCRMYSGEQFCPICTGAIDAELKKDLGL